MSTILITGGAGFIGSHLVDAMLLNPEINEIRVIDNFSSGRVEHLLSHSDNQKLKIITEDLLNLDQISPHFKDCTLVFHLSANPDARYGISNTRLDLEQETIVTYHVLESMRRNDCHKIVFSSSGTVYGDIGTSLAHEGTGPTLPISLYGAGKVASEALISAYCGTFGLSSIILRFGNVVGERTTHGVIFDFIKQLSNKPSQLKVLGNGLQSKPYIYVKDLVRALEFAFHQLEKFSTGSLDVFNVAPTGATSVRFIAESLILQLGLHDCEINYGESPVGWPGDVAQSRMNSNKLFNRGFRLERSSDEAVVLAIESIFDWIKSRGDRGDGLNLKWKTV